MSTLLQIVPKMPGSLDGVGDYALTIARKLREKFNCETVFSAFNTQENSSGFEVLSLDRLPDESSKFNHVLLHYVNYGFQKRGVPFRLLSILRALRRQHRGKFITIFHELYASGPPWKSAFWLQPFQKGLAKSVAQLSDVCFVSNDYSRRAMRQLAPRVEIELHPVPSAIGEPSLSNDQIVNRDSHTWVIFGGTALTERSLRSFRRRMSRIPDSIAPRRLFVLGGEENPATRSLVDELGIESSYRPRIAGSDASGILRTCSFAWLDYFHRPDVETSVILKSSAFASACAHGVIPVFPHRSSAVAIEGDRLPGPFFVETNHAETPDSNARPKTAIEIYDWYRRCAASDFLVGGIAAALELR